MAPVIRRSCDRCHSQKLRCPRPSEKLGACDRCLRKGARCVYSCSLPKGRPSVYKVAEKSGGIATRSRDDTAGSSRPPLVRADGPHSLPVNNNCTNLLEETDQTADVRPQPDLAGSSSLIHSVEQGLNILADSRQRLGSLAWDDNQASHWSNPSLTQPAHTTVGPFLPLDNTQGLMDWASLGDEPSGVHLLPHPPDQQQELENGNRESQNRIDDGNASDSDGTTILQFSQLIMRFSRLQRLSYELAPKPDSLYLANDLNQAPDKPLVDETTFVSVFGWLTHDSSNLVQRPRSTRSPTQEDTTSDVLCRVFSASHTFLEALHGLQRDVGTKSSASTSPSIGSNMSLYSTLDTATTSYPRSPSHHCTSAVRHLAMTCYTILLSIYVSILNRLEQDAGGRTDGASSGDIRLASIVQLCSYLVERQHKAMEVYLTTQKPPEGSWEELLNSSYDQTSVAVEEEMQILNVEVEQRLARLKQALHFGP
ncbi:hypothetical protein EKO27_g11243 [Xylaria grammica]|uniref:Zn(2)-C6 fungal-type domain-containing protein n=1 Tax=Xylaria grammica TaxID=363999 RepID=A0A439CNX6_9PEZI|nr:hypothetical protein EKO27_g11243 [Xylaria grammica]